MKILKDHLGFIVFFSLTIAVFLYPLIIMRSAFLYGDSFVQFFPWLKCYAEAIKSFSFPYWIREMGSGFPLMAEGQVGGFYPFNILFFFLLPLNVAYNYSIIFHFVIGGIFTYLYTRKVGADEAGGYLAALLFCFGSAYGGCFYNIVTLRTLAWFPLVLLLIERYFDDEALKYIGFAGIVLGFQLLAGFVQMAMYSAFFYAVYLIYKAMIVKTGVRKVLCSLFILSSISFIISLPQLLLTYQLAGFSNREAATLDFALWGSFLPPGLLGLLFPYSFSFRSNLYVGMLSLLFVIFSLRSLKKDKILWPIVSVLIFSIFLALGRFNPIYVALLKMTKLYIFRNPSKFLFFGAFALSVLAGVGITKFFNSNSPKERRISTSVFIYILSIVGSLFFVIKFLLSFFKDSIIKFGDHYVRYFVYNKSNHRYSLEYYIEKVRLMYDTLAINFSSVNKFVIFNWYILIVVFLFCFLFLRKRVKYTAILIIFIDLLIFSFYGSSLNNNLKPFSFLVPDSQNILNRLTIDPEICRILPFDLKSEKLPNWSLPNANIIYNIDSVACYTPLAGRSYMDKLAGLEVIDDSLGLKNSQEAAIKGRLETIRLLNVKYIVSQKILSEEFLEKVGEDYGVFLYRLKDHFSRLFFSYDITSAIKQVPLSDLEIVNYKNGFIEARMTVGKDGFIVFSENYYPGWRVFVDGKERAMIKVNGILQGVAIESGHHNVIFSYKPQLFSIKR